MLRIIHKVLNSLLIWKSSQAIKEWLCSSIQSSTIKGRLLVFYCQSGWCYQGTANSSVKWVHWLTTKHNNTYFNQIYCKVLLSHTIVIDIYLWVSYHGSFFSFFPSEILGGAQRHSGPPTLEAGGACAPTAPPVPTPMRYTFNANENARCNNSNLIKIVDGYSIMDYAFNKVVHLRFTPQNFKVK